MFSASFPNLYITSYEQALAKWESITPIRGRRDDVRPVFRRDNDNAVVRKTSNDSIVFRLYSTDVVTFNTDGTVDLEPYASNSTNNFVWSILRLRTLWADRHRNIPDHITEVEGRYYHTPEFVTVQWSKDTNRWSYVAGAEPFDVPRLDKSMTSRAKEESGYNAFALWLNTQLRLGIDPRMGDSWRQSAYDWSSREVGQYLASGPENWAEMTRRMSKRTNIDTELAALRLAVYKWGGCVDTTEVPHFENQSTMMAAFSRMRKYG